MPPPPTPLPTPFGTGRLESLEAGQDIAATPSAVLVEGDHGMDEDDLLYLQAIKVLTNDEAHSAVERASLAVEQAKLTTRRATAIRHHEYAKATPPSAIAIDFARSGSSASSAATRATFQPRSQRDEPDQTEASPTRNKQRQATTAQVAVTQRQQQRRCLHDRLHAPSSILLRRRSPSLLRKWRSFSFHR